MNRPSNPARRALLQRAAIGLSLAPLALGRQRPAWAADPPLLSEQDAAALKVHYVAAASRAKGAQPGAICSTCALYDGASGAAQGGCSLFPGKLVAAAGWCDSWSTV